MFRFPLAGVPVTIHGSFLLTAAVIGLASAGEQAPLLGVTWVAVVLLLSGTGTVGFSVMQATLVYRGAPVAMRARLLGVLSVCIGTGPIGFLYLGFLADVLTPRVGTVALAAQGILALLFTRRYWTPVLRA